MVAAAPRDYTRRHFFSQCSLGLGSVALASLMNGQAQASTQGLHHRPKAENVIYLFMAGGPSQL